MWHRVDLVLTDVSDERITSIFRVEKSASEEPALGGVCRLNYQSWATRFRLVAQSAATCSRWFLARGFMFSIAGSVCNHLLTLVPHSRIYVFDWWLSLQPPAHAGSSFADLCFRLVAQSAATCSRWFLARGFMFSTVGSVCSQSADTRMSTVRKLRFGLLHDVLRSCVWFLFFLINSKCRSVDDSNVAASL
jgi:hypothetical protein